MPVILITGATGFIGRQLSKQLVAKGWQVRGTLLSSEQQSILAKGVEPFVLSPFSGSTLFSNVLLGVDTIVHLAARVHIMKEIVSDPLAEFRIVNTDATKTLAKQAAKAGVKRLVFMSTIGVNGDNSGNDSYTELSQPLPHNHYSISKYEAEQLLQEISAETGLQVVIVRAPLVYGPENPGNFLLLLKLIRKNIPLPFASITNKRSLIYVGNLVDALAICATHSDAAGKIYLVSDGEDISTPELIWHTAAALDVPVRLLPFPVSLMRLVGRLTGKSAVVSRLTESLTVDSSKIRRELEWQPPFTMEQGLKITAEWFRSQ